MGSAILFLEALFFSVLAPMLPSLKHDLALSTSQAGIVVAMFALGSVIGTVPAALVSARVGVKPAAIGGLVTLAAMSAAFGAARGYVPLLVTRFMQGIGGGAVWTATMAWLIDAFSPRRRGEVIGVVFGAAAVGSITGPLLGDVAVTVGRAGSFAGIAAVAMLLAIAAARSTAPPTARRRVLRVGQALRARGMSSGMWVACLPGIQLGAIGVLAPLRLHQLRAGPGWIAATFGVAAAASVLVRPAVGRWSDRCGRLRPLRFTLAANVIVLLVIGWPAHRWSVAVLVFVAVLATGCLWGPAMALLSDICERTGAGQVVAAAIMSVVGSLGYVAGAAASGAVAQAAGQGLGYAVLAALGLVTLLVVFPRLDPARAGTT
jgi:MFS family permease